jgi:hypothetical protein
MVLPGYLPVCFTLGKVRGNKTLPVVGISLLPSHQTVCQYVRGIETSASFASAPGGLCLAFRLRLYRSAGSTAVEEMKQTSGDRK